MGFNQRDMDSVRRFCACWESLFQKFPETRAKAVAEMGKVVQEEVQAQIIAQGVDDREGHVRSWPQAS